jgi:multidrug efflux pump subunit AcrB
MIRWFAHNGVAANLLAAIVVVGGLLSLPKLEMEMFPEFSLDTIAVTVPYPGATPTEVEEGIVLRIEEAVQGLEGIKRIQSTAAEGFGRVLIEVQKGYSLNEVKENIKTRVDAITTFPVDAERHTVEEFLFPRDVLFVAIFGEVEEHTLRRLSERVRDDLVTLPGISQANLFGVRDYEISIEVNETALRQYRLTFDEIAQAVRRSSLDLPGGSIKADGGEILLRTMGQAYVGAEFAQIVLRVNPDGSRIVLSDVATINDGFVDLDVISMFNGKPAGFVQVREVGEESPLDISAKVVDYLETFRHQLPPGVEIVKFGDSSFYLRDRLNLLVKNGLIGLVLVVLVLTAFLRPMLALFVAFGIPVSFLGTLFLAPYIGLTINMVSLFAFILVLGIVVDDAIVVGESVFSEYQENGPGVESSIRGTHAVSVPVTFAVLTTVVAFIPLFFLPGVMGKLFAPIPAVVIATLLWSLVESKLVLPYHLSLLRTAGSHRPDSRLNFPQRMQRRIANSLEFFVGRFYRPFLALCLKFRYTTMVGFVVSLLLAVGLMVGGWVRQVPFPPVPSDFIQATIEYPDGTAIEEVQRGVERIYAGLESVVAEEEAKGLESPIAYRATFSMGSTHEVLILAELTKSESRKISALEIEREWRDAIGVVPGAKSLSFVSEAAMSNEKPINVQLVGRDFEEVKEAAREIKAAMREVPAVYGIGDNFSSGKREIQLRVKERAEVLGITSTELGRQVRNAFYGAEAQRIQRGRNEVRVMVRYPREDRESVGNLESMRIRLPDGREVPFSEVADIEIGTGFSSIQRVNRARVINITADIDRENADVAKVTEAVDQRVEEILATHAGVASSLEGQTAEDREFKGSLLRNGLLMLIGIYMLLAIPLRSYLQPGIVMLAIPFALVGAVFGHVVTFQPLSSLSYMGIVAAIGVVVNDSLVLVDYVNKKRREGLSPAEAAKRGAERRFRPILLTSLTTFAGLIPILLERSLQAQFLIPMATSLAFGVLFATFITLLLVPCAYLALEDIKRLFRGKEM